MAIIEPMTFAALLAVLLPAVWTLLTISDRWLGRRGPRPLRAYHFRLNPQGVRRGQPAGASQAPARFLLIRTAPKPRTKRRA